jgi:hypothetical protein
MTTSTAHSRATNVGDVVADKLVPLLARALVAVALVLLIPSVAWGAAQIAGALAHGMDPTKVIVIQSAAAVISAAGMAGVIAGIDRFTRRTPVVKR